MAAYPEIPVSGVGVIGCKTFNSSHLNYPLFAHFANLVYNQLWYAFGARGAGRSQYPEASYCLPRGKEGQYPVPGSGVTESVGEVPNLLDWGRGRFVM